MDRTRTHGVFLAAVGALIVIAVIVVLVLVVNAESGFDGCTSAGQFGWIAPLLAMSIIGGLAWVLLSQNHTVGEDDPHVPSVECPECGRTVMGEWRMCPYCGDVLDPKYSNHSE